MKKLWLAFAALLFFPLFFAPSAQAQLTGPVQWVGPVTAGHCMIWETPGVAEDSGVSGCGSGGSALPVCIIDQLIYYVANGDVGVCLTLGTNLSITSGVLNASGGGGGGAFNDITSGTNTSAAMVVGTGASLGVTGSGTITASGVPVTGVTGMGTGVGTFLITPSATNLGAAVTGAGLVAGTNVTITGTWPNQTVNSSGGGGMVYPGAGIPQSTGSAWGTSITLGTGVVTALGDNVGSAGAVVVNGGALGTPSSGIGTNLTGTASALSIGGTASNLSGTPALPNGTTGTTQSVADNTTKLATDAFVLANAGGTPSFSAVTAGTNTAALVVGSGGSITATGTGGVTATAVPVGGITGLGTGVETFLVTPTAANLGSAVTGAGAVAGGGIAISGTWPTQTVSSSYSVRTVTSSTDTILPTDCANGVYYSNAGSVAVTLPQAIGSFAGCGVDISTSSATTVTITPTTSTINGGATAVVGPALWDQVVAVSGNYNAYGTAVSFNAGVTYLLDEGTKFSIASGTGACATTTTLTGGTAIGSFMCSGTSGASTAVITLPTAPNGIWICKSLDKTTSADTFNQTTWSATSATLGGTIVSGDVIGFNCGGS